MKKKTAKLHLSRETLRLLDTERLKQVDGGITGPRCTTTNATSCPSFCQVSTCL